MSTIEPNIEPNIESHLWISTLDRNKISQFIHAPIQARLIRHNRSSSKIYIHYPLNTNTRKFWEEEYNLSGIPTYNDFAMLILYCNIHFINIICDSHESDNYLASIVLGEFIHALYFEYMYITEVIHVQDEHNDNNMERDRKFEEVLNLFLSNHQNGACFTGRFVYPLIDTEEPGPTQKIQWVYYDQSLSIINPLDRQLGRGTGYWIATEV